jgi:hypothetical protein
MLSPRHAAVLLILPLAACAGPLNNEPGIGNAGRAFGHSVYTPATIAEGLPAPEPEGLAPSADQSAAPVYEAGGAVDAQNARPSVTSLDRENWAMVRVDVPSDFPAHQPRLARDYLVKTSDPRAQGRYPNERTALGTETTRHANEQFVEALVSPFVAAQNVIMMIPRAIVEMRPRRPTRTGGEGYERYPRQVTIINPTAEAEGPASRVEPGAAPAASQRRPGVAPGSRTVPDQTPGEELRPGGGMPASDSPRKP